GLHDRGRWAGLLAEASLERAAQPLRICQLCVEMLGLTGAGISIVTETGNRGVVCATDEVSAEIEQLQFSLGEGPCIDAVASGAPVLVPDLQQPSDVIVDRWPAFMAHAGSVGVRAVFALPLTIGAIRVGAMDLYRDSPGELGSDELSAALMAADAAAVGLLHMDTAHVDVFADDAGARSTYQLQVHQATGMVSAQVNVPIEEALLLLRARAFADGRPVTVVAKDVVERRMRFDKEDR
ncbi:MAG: hypothetical protein JWO88_3332, partial [Frankiales bacterium]|nr:hypothetical protein [Frankiales bacterium]